eukprot:NODE_48_length_27236_cov_0.507573.p1 type:complete len:189 gc:universal NODE_48_length_27236_cov_0.507573:20060-20626(+)
MINIINMLIPIIIITAIITILSKKIETSVFSLVLTFALSGVIFISIGVPFFGFIYLLVYTAAISILFLFVIMMLDLPNPMATITDRITRGVIFTIMIGLFIIVIYKNITSKVVGEMSKGKIWEREETPEMIKYHQEWAIQTLDTMQGLAYTLYTEQVSLLILIAIILLIVMVAIINYLYTTTTNNINK